MTSSVGAPLVTPFSMLPSVIGSMTEPNDSQRQRLAWTRERFDRAVEALDDAVAEAVPALNRLLEGAGAPTVAVPVRGEGTG